MIKILKGFENLRLLIFLATFFYFTIWIFQGFDTTDTGFFLIQQWEMAKGNFVEHADLHWLSNYLASFWLRVINKPYLLWAKLGSVFFHALVTFLVFLTLERYFKEKRRFFLVVFATATAIPGSFDVIGGFSGLFIILSIYTLNLLLNSRNPKRYIAYSTIFGIILGLLPFLRFPHLFFLTIPIFIWFYNRYVDTVIDKQKTKYFISFTLIGVTIAFVLSILLLHINGGLKVYLSEIQTRFINGFIKNQEAFGKNTYTMKYQIIRWIRDYALVILFISLLSNVFMLELLKLVRAKIYSKTSFFKKALFASPFLFLLFVLAMIGKLWIVKTYIIPGFIFSTSFIYIFNYKNTDERISKLKMLLFIGVTVMVLTGLGSNIFARRFIGGAWLALPISIMLLYENFDVSRHSNYYIKGLSSIPFYLIIFLLLVLSVLNHSSPYRDGKRWNLTSSFESSYLKGIHTTKERRETVEAVLNKIEEYVQPREKILCVGKIPMLYYLTNTTPFLKELWPSYLPEKLFENELERKWNDTNYPKIVVVTKKSVSDSNWPNTDQVYLANTPAYNILMKYLTKFKYRVGWENEMFRIYVKSSSPHR